MGLELTPKRCIGNKCREKDTYKSKKLVVFGRRKLWGSSRLRCVQKELKGQRKQILWKVDLGYRVMREKVTPSGELILNTDPLNHGGITDGTRGQLMESVWWSWWRRCWVNFQMRWIWEDKTCIGNVRGAIKSAASPPGRSWITKTGESLVRGSCWSDETEWELWQSVRRRNIRALRNEIWGLPISQGEANKGDRKNGRQE